MPIDCCDAHDVRLQQSCSRTAAFQSDEASIVSEIPKEAPSSSSITLEQALNTLQSSKQTTNGHFVCWLCREKDSTKMGHQNKKSLQKHLVSEHTKQELRQLHKATRNNSLARRTFLALQGAECTTRTAEPKIMDSAQQFAPLVAKYDQEHLTERLHKLTQSIHKTATELMTSDYNKAHRFLKELETINDRQKSESAINKIEKSFPGVKEEPVDAEEHEKSCSICHQLLPTAINELTNWVKCEECGCYTHGVCREVDLPCPSCLRGLMKRLTQ